MAPDRMADQQPVDDDAGQPTTDQGGLLSRSFLGLLVTQFLGAINDNMFRWLVVPIGKDIVGPERAATALSAGLACFVLPYILLAAPAGYLADRFSKRTVIVGCKVAEVVIMVLGVATILTGNIYLMFAVVALMGAAERPVRAVEVRQHSRDRPRASRSRPPTGWSGMTTVLAIVVGTVAGNMLYLARPSRSGRSITGGSRPRRWSAWPSLGWLASLLDPPAASGQSRRGGFPSIRRRRPSATCGPLGANRPLLRAALGTSFFWSLAALAQMNVDLFAITELHVAPASTSGRLLAVLGAGRRASGVVLAGVWSAGQGRTGHRPAGAGGIAVSSILLFGVPGPRRLGSVGRLRAGPACGCSCLGIGAGLVRRPAPGVPPASQPGPSRGASILAATNFLTFSGMLVAAGVFWLVRQVARTLGPRHLPAGWDWSRFRFSSTSSGCCPGRRSDSSSGC